MSIVYHSQGPQNIIELAFLLKYIVNCMKLNEAQIFTNLPRLKFQIKYKSSHPEFV